MKFFIVCHKKHFPSSVFPLNNILYAIIVVIASTQLLDECNFIHSSHSHSH